MSKLKDNFIEGAVNDTEATLKVEDFKMPSTSVHKFANKMTDQDYELVERHS